jgi:hypothetical protein
MTHRSLFRAFLLLLLVLVPLAMLASPGSRSHRRSMSISVDDDEDITRCDQIRVTFDNDGAARGEEAVAVAGLRSLRVDAARNGGIHVTGWDRADYSVTACKAAMSFGSTLSGVHARVDGDKVTAVGPDDNDDWVVYFLVRAPRGATLTLHSSNGGISLQRVNGTVTASAHNGPISLKETGGSIDAHTQNGPISLAGGSGRMKLDAQNGPISVKLSGNDWNGEGLDARTQNGPLSLRLPASYRSGVVVESDGRSPFSCKGSACRSAKRAYDNDNDGDDEEEFGGRLRRVELGGATAVVRMSTVNGPVSVKSE